MNVISNTVSANGNKIGYIAGYSNPRLRINAYCNVKPVKVILQTPKELFGSDIGIHYEYYAVHLDKNDNPTKKYVKTLDSTVCMFDNYEDAVLHYNKCVDDVINQHNVIIDKLNSLKL